MVSTEIWFYHLASSTLRNELPKLLEKAYQNGKRCKVKLPTEQDVIAMSKHLWSYHPDAFLPHGHKSDGDPDVDPIWLSTDDTNPNGAEILILTDGTRAENITLFSRCIRIFDANHADGLQQARFEWKHYRAKGFNVVYYKREPSGKWIQQTETK